MLPFDLLTVCVVTLCATAHHGHVTVLFTHSTLYILAVVYVTS